MDGDFDSRQHSTSLTLAAERGFTLVELLVVVLVLGIIAAIAIPNFLLQQSKAHDSSAKSAARTAMSALEVYSTDHAGYLGATMVELRAIEPTLEDAQGMDLPVATASGYQLVSPSTSLPPVTFTVLRAGGTTTFTCTPTGQGGCPANGFW